MFLSILNTRLPLSSRERARARESEKQFEANVGVRLIGCCILSEIFDAMKRLFEQFDAKLGHDKVSGAVLLFNHSLRFFKYLNRSFVWLEIDRGEGWLCTDTFSHEIGRRIERNTCIYKYLLMFCFFCILSVRYLSLDSSWEHDEGLLSQSIRKDTQY